MSTILCIDDEEAALETMKALLQCLGHNVVTSSTGAIGLYLLECRPDVQLVILDYRMEPMDGMAVAAAIKSSFPRTPILLHSGQDDIPAQLLEIVDAVVGKGSPIPELISSIDGLLGRTRSGPQRAEEVSLSLKSRAQ
jgi:CheY-like chemotaxis protein